ncbi:hypothetical protein SEPCBS119000_001626 [Sporothrix epigloea]|uniref:DNA mismatch repair protein S5 domain-containing protein n=1 Tax=Sporothrix epigloea TaxID=1892477 RepID=A0ABP0DET7_9PEZI
MSIKALSAETCSLLGSTTLIASPVSLVKELVDNAVDAYATTISILVSPNTVDKIEVRDDGHGIDSADFDVLGRRGHTSKIRCFEDLKDVGGSTLGFRGEGLASANTLGNVAITTRTANKAVASLFRLKPGTGGINPGTHRLAPAQIGTTVAVTCLFHALPVRRKIIIKDATKTINAIKALLCGYAMARPQLRFSLKIMTAAVPEWTYSSLASKQETTEQDSMRQSVLLLFGAEVARQCEEIVISTNELLGCQATLPQFLSNKSENKTGNYIFEACLPRPSATWAKLKLGGFVSVDGRPLSTVHHQGIAQRLLAVFTSSLERILTETDARHANVKGTFIRLNIRCPAGTYDVNVDSAKTDVLLADEKVVYDAWTALCAKVYVPPDRLRYVQTAGTLPSTPLRTRPAFLFTDNVNGRKDRRQSQLQTPEPDFSHNRLDTNSDPDHQQDLLVGDSTSMSSLHGKRPGGVKSHTLGPESMFKVSTVVSRSDENDQMLSKRCSTRSAPDPQYIDIQLSPIRNSRQRQRYMPAGGLQTPPSVSLRMEQRVQLARNQAHSRVCEGQEEPFSRDGLRQTTITFLGQNRRMNHDKSDATQGRRNPGMEASAIRMGNANTLRRSTVSAHGPCRQKQGIASLSSTMESENSDITVQLDIQNWECARAALAIPHTPPPSQIKTGGQRPSFMMRVNWRQLRRDSAAYTRNERVWNKENDFLSPEPTEVSSIESQLQLVVMAWLSKAEVFEIETDQGKLQAKIDLRKSLKRKACRDSRSKRS